MVMQSAKNCAGARIELIFATVFVSFKGNPFYSMIFQRARASRRDFS
jgi:hypothetical protein